MNVRVEPAVDVAVGDRTRLALGGEFSRTTAAGNFLRSDVRRVSYAAYAALQQQVGAEGAIVRHIFLYPALRYDAVRTGEEVLASWSPQLGAVIGFQEVGGLIMTGVRASVSRNFRAPTFNELFYAGGGGLGNPHLQPERSTSIDVGMDLKLSLLGTHQLQCTYFDMSMNNRIVWVPTGSFTVMPKNLRNVRSRGVEVAYQWTTLDDHVTIGWNYTSLTARKTQPDSPGDPNANAHLIYIPQEQAHYSIAFRHGFEGSFLREIGAMVAASFVGFRFTSEDNRNFLPSYTIADANIHARLRVTDVSLLLRVEVNNLSNQDYQSVPAYPMPLRSYRATLGIEL
jgi:outer membrane receptor protein involved in Fe transport